MQLKKLACVTALAARREALLAYRTGGRIHVMIDGVHEDSMDDLATPVVNRELDARIAEVDRRLAELGVTIN